MTTRAVRQFIEEALAPFPGATFVVVRETTHVILDLTYRGKTTRIGVTKTPSDHRSRLNDRAQMRRALKALEP